MKNMKIIGSHRVIYLSKKNSNHKPSKAFLKALDAVKEAGKAKAKRGRKPKKPSK